MTNNTDLINIDDLKDEPDTSHFSWLKGRKAEDPGNKPVQAKDGKLGGRKKKKPATNEQR